MKEHKELILAEMDKCLVTDDEWQLILKQEMAMKIEDDPFKKAIFDFQNFI